MCPPRPKPKPLPPATPIAPAPEKTAKNVVVGSSRQEVGEGKRIKTARKRKPTGTESLRIPVTVTSNLRY